MDNLINVATAEVKKGESGNILVSIGIGSRTVVAAMNLRLHRVALAHIILPGKAPENRAPNDVKYAENTIDELLKLACNEDKDTSHIKACLVGPGNVLKNPNDSVCHSNIQPAQSILKDTGIRIDAQSLGGEFRRTVLFDIENAKVHFTEGNSNLQLLKKWCH